MNSFIVDYKTDELNDQGTARPRRTGAAHAREIMLSGLPSSLLPHFNYALRPLRLKFLIPH